MTETPVVDEKKSAPKRRSQKVWAFLLVVDSFFVIIFGGAVAAKVYQHWQAPAVDAAPRSRKAVRVQAAKSEPKPAEPAPAPKEPEPAPAPKAEPAKPAKAEPHNGPTPRPSMDAPPRQAAQPQTSSQPAPKPAAPAAPAAADAQKAVPHEFSIKQPGAKSVELAGAFLVRTGGRKAMISHPDGTWTLTLYLTPNTYRYWFLINGKKALDPQNPKNDRGASVVTVAP